MPRLLVRQRLSVLAAVPLVGLLLTTVPLIASAIDRSRGSARTADSVQRAVTVARLTGELQRERLLSVAYLLGPAAAERTALTAQSTLVDQATRTLRDRPDAGAATWSAAVGRLEAVRAQVLRRSVAPAAVATAYGSAAGAVLDLLGTDRRSLAGSGTGARGTALITLLQADEASSAAAAGLLVAVADRDSGPDLLADVSARRAVDQQQLTEFGRVARPEDAALVDSVSSGQATALVDETAAALLAHPARRGALAGDRTGRLARLYAAVDTVAGLRRAVESRVAADAAAAVAGQERDARTVAALVVLGSLLLLVLVLALSAEVGRSITQPLVRLTGAVSRIAEISRAELLRVADDERADAGPPRLAAVDVGTPDELGDLALAINQVQATAVLLLDRQVAGRRNVATMLGNIGRRTQSLVGRQLDMIDELEREAPDPELLERLYRLDHVSVRLRRSANSLLVLSGRREPALGMQSLSVTEVVRAAAQEIEGFTRLRMGAAEVAMLAPTVVGDLIPLLAELLENGTSFSPPNSMVDVGATAESDGSVRIRIVDHGIGMTPEQIAEENARLVSRERLDLAPTDVLGLFVVGRLARRHGVGVTLLPTPQTGVTAEVLLPARLVERRLPAEPEATPPADESGPSPGWGGMDAAEWTPGGPPPGWGGTEAAGPGVAAGPGWGGGLDPDGPSAGGVPAGWAEADRAARTSPQLPAAARPGVAGHDVAGRDAGGPEVAGPGWGGMTPGDAQPPPPRRHASGMPGRTGSALGDPALGDPVPGPGPEWGGMAPRETEPAPVGWSGFGAADGPAPATARSVAADWSWWDRSLPQPPDPSRPRTGDPGPRITDPGLPGTDAYGSVAGPAEVQPAGAGAPGPGWLARRVPGARLPAGMQPGAAASPAAAFEPAPAVDPVSAAEAARAMIDEFRAGSARALAAEPDGPATGDGAR